MSDDGVLRLGWASDDSGQGLRGWRVVRACRQDGSVCAYLGFGEVCGGRGMWSECECGCVGGGGPPVVVYVGVFASGGVACVCVLWV